MWLSFLPWLHRAVLTALGWILVNICVQARILGLLRLDHRKRSGVWTLCLLFDHSWLERQLILPEQLWASVQMFRCQCILFHLLFWQKRFLERPLSWNYRGAHFRLRNGLFLSKQLNQLLTIHWIIRIIVASILLLPSTRRAYLCQFFETVI